MAKKFFVNRIGLSCAVEGMNRCISGINSGGRLIPAKNGRKKFLIFRKNSVTLCKKRKTARGKSDEK